MIKLIEGPDKKKTVLNLISKNVYGNELIYPDCELSRFVTHLTGKKTLDPNNIATLKKLNYEIRIGGVTI